MLLGIVEKRENSFIQAVNEMSFVIPFHGHHVEGRGGGGQSCSPPGCTQAGVLLVAFVPYLFIYLFWEEGEMFKSITTRPPLPHGGPAEPRCPPPTLHQKPPTPSQFRHEPLAGFTNLPVTGVLAGNWELINVHLGG